MLLIINNFSPYCQVWHHGSAYIISCACGNFHVVLVLSFCRIIYLFAFWKCLLIFLFVCDAGVAYRNNSEYIIEHETCARLYLALRSLKLYTRVYSPSKLIITSELSYIIKFDLSNRILDEASSCLAIKFFNVYMGWYFFVFYMHLC